jgi:hypothetical protein
MVLRDGGNPDAPHVLVYQLYLKDQHVAVHQMAPAIDVDRILTGLARPVQISHGSRKHDIELPGTTSVAAPHCNDT